MSNKRVAGGASGSVCTCSGAGRCAEPQRWQRGLSLYDEPPEREGELAAEERTDQTPLELLQRSSAILLPVSGRPRLSVGNSSIPGSMPTNDRQAPRQNKNSNKQAWEIACVRRAARCATRSLPTYSPLFLNWQVFCPNYYDVITFARRHSLLNARIDYFVLTSWLCAIMMMGFKLKRAWKKLFLSDHSEAHRLPLQMRGLEFGFFNDDESNLNLSPRGLRADESQSIIEHTQYNSLTRLINTMLELLCLSYAVVI